MRDKKTGLSEAEAARRYKTALGRALVYNLEEGIDWKLDARGRLAPVPRSFVEPITGKIVGSSNS